MQFLDQSKTAAVNIVAPNRMAAIVLCGGKSTRMGMPKLMLPFGSETLLERVVRILNEVLPTVVVVAARSQDLPMLPAGTRIARDELDDQGPLAGIASGLATARRIADAAYISSCDVPLLKPAFVRLMISALGTHELAIADDGNFQHPLAAVYRMTLEEQIRQMLAEGKRSPTSLVRACDSRIVEADELRNADPTLESLRNVNTRNDYVAALRDAGFVNS
jgi:molybdopterin-guanine dinucleotide biosynthesis protein A